jgi:hypothetical protein
LHPGIDIDAARPLFDQASALAGPVGLFTNAPQIAIQLFVTLIEFKLVTLAGFVLVPFGLFGRTAFLAERVLGNPCRTRNPISYPPASRPYILVCRPPMEPVICRSRSLTDRAPRLSQG